MREIGISNKLRERIMETYKETKNVVKVGEKCTEDFKTKKGVRQECPMSPTLFNIYVANLDEMKKGGVVVKRRKIWTLMYANDIVLLAERDELKEMLKRFKRFLEKKSTKPGEDKSDGV